MIYKPQRVLMVSPEYFTVEYAINPYMKTPTGELQKIDSSKALAQWNNLKALYEKLGFEVFVIPGQKDLPDMVFAANQSFPFLDSKTGKLKILMGHMNSEKRQPEVRIFKKWYEDQGIEAVELESPYSFEGNGDFLIHPGTGEVLAGYGHRTDKKVFQEISQRFSLKIIPLELIDEHFYHLDTCLTILNQDTVGICREAFTPEGLTAIKKSFKTVIEISKKECLEHFAGNAHSPNGKDVILQKGSRDFVKTLQAFGFKTHETDVSEFQKSGGSVFCLKMMF
jgi:N-dimethylarginine dimethylaminohydrolase